MAAGTRPQGKLLDYEQFIDHQLGLTRARIKMTDVFTAGVLLVATVVGVVFLEVLLDHMFGLPFWLRQVVLILGAAAIVAFTAMRVVMPMLGRVNGLYAAKTIEGADPAFKNSLINYLQLREHRGEMSRTIMAAVEAKAVDDLAKIQVDDVVNQKRLVQTFYALAGIVVVFCIYAFLTPKPILDSIKRALLADVARPTNTQLVNIKPGDDPKLQRVVASANVEFSTEIKGERPKSVTLHFSTDGTHYLTRELKQKANGNDYDPWKFVFPNVQQPMDYYFRASDAQSRTYHLDVLPEPIVVSFKHDLEFPSYTGVARRTDVEGGDIEAIEGTIATIKARTNQPAQTAWMMVAKPQEKNPRQIDWPNADKVLMTVSETDAHELTGRIKVAFNGRYQINFQTTGGQTNPDAQHKEIKSLKDNPPAARFVRPERPALKLPSNAKLPLQVKATDDFGVKETTLHVQMQKDVLQPAKDYLEGKTPTRDLAQDDVLDLAALKVKPGETIEYWLTVRDTKEPVANRVETQHQTIEVTDPASKEELQKIEQQQKPEEPPPADPQDDTPPPPPEQDTQPDAQKKPGENQEKGEGDQAGDPKDGQGEPQDPKDDQQPQPQDREMTEQERQKMEQLEKALSKLSNQNKPNNQGKPNQGGNTPPSDSKNANPPQSKDQAGTQNKTQNQQNQGKTPPPQNNNPQNTMQPQQGDQQQQNNQDPNKSPEVSRNQNPQQNQKSNNEQSKDQQGQKGDAQSKDQQGQKGDAQSKDQQGQKGDAQSKDQQGQKGDAQSKDQQGQKGDAQSKDQQGQKGDAQSKDMQGQKGQHREKVHAEEKVDPHTKGNARATGEPGA